MLGPKRSTMSEHQLASRDSGLTSRGACNNSDSGKHYSKLPGQFRARNKLRRDDTQSEHSLRGAHFGSGNIVRNTQEVRNIEELHFKQALQNKSAWRLEGGSLADEEMSIDDIFPHTVQ